MAVIKIVVNGGSVKWPLKLLSSLRTLGGALLIEM